MSNQIPTRDLSPDPVRVVQPKSADLYAKREKIHARAITGLFQNIRLVTLYLTMAVFFLLPWIDWEGRQAVLFDLSNRHFYIFWWTFLPEDFFFLSWLFIIAAFALFAVTVLAGRVWCGYACPQTVWTKVFMWIEEVAEGNRNARLRLDKAPMSLRKFIKRIIKHSGWAVVSIGTGIAFIGYFTPMRDLWEQFTTLSMDPWMLFWMLFFAGATYLNAGWMREQVCLHICPYGRFQSVMFDRDTLIISYDNYRGDPRGSRGRHQSSEEVGLGDCIDCKLCVQVCPTGIDIRDGLQFECIQCAACIDACDSVMDQMGYARGLVKYTTENLLENTGDGKYHFLRPSLIIYSLALTVMISALLLALFMRTPLSIEAMRDRGALFTESYDGVIENSYTLKVQNKSQKDYQYRIEVRCDSIPVTMEGGTKYMTLQAGELATVPLTVTLQDTDMKGRSADIEFVVTRIDDESIQDSTESTFMMPRR
ncbi:MAG: cytochrome c oxidase accessory protein CcoG [Paraperlucidibaca sp.]|nr:cytochrome c oxidase accessory protein CcoG [Paraperlucidibaca sp.]MBQ0723425.1 cytochrome c oxidase accessory protein CcoG [Paraperlucidibaca sp.]MBQ0842195.1 cytochrome c oxidase accessory protein CcoG [Paraperlucidibaca sp.]